MAGGPDRSSRAIAGVADGFSRSARMMSPATAPSRPTQTAVRPSASALVAASARTWAVADAIPASARNRAVPTRTVRPSTSAVTPPPATAVKPVTTIGSTSIPSAPACRTMAEANGCSLPRSAAAASRSSAWRASGPGSVASTTLTSARPRVSVPVLSSTTSVTVAARSTAAASRRRMPASAPRPAPTIRAVGVARPMAHGQAMIRTPIALASATGRRGSGPNTIQVSEGQGGARRRPPARTR